MALEVGSHSARKESQRKDSKESKMLSTLVLFLLSDLASSDIVFLKPPNGKDIARNELNVVKWRKVPGASDYLVSMNSSRGGRTIRYITPQGRCNPRFSIALIPAAGCWDVRIVARSQNGDPINDRGSISFRVCESLPCPGERNATDADCPAGEVLRYYTAPGYKVDGGTPDYTFTAVNEEECVDTCTNNPQPFGPPCDWLAPCKSVDFNNETGQCDIYTALTFPQGTATLDIDSATNHYEKVCVNAYSGTRCPGPYLVEPHKYSYGNSQGDMIDSMFSTHVSDVNACFKQCIDNIFCGSANFNTDEQANINCEVRRDTRADIQSGLLDAGISWMSVDGFTYFEKGHCPG